MDKLPKSKGEIERLLIAELHGFPNCEDALLIDVTADHTNTASWTVSRFDHGRSDGWACDRALQHIVPLFQRVYDLVRKH
jgi:hypothetical protein